MAGFQNCQKAKIGFSTETSGQQGLGGPNGNACNNQVLNTITTPIKLLLIVDTSGSNADDPSTNRVGTDDGKVMRAGSISQFFADYGAKTNFNWGFLTFHGGSASTLIPNFGDASAMQTAIVDFAAVVDTGATPYKSALMLAKTLVDSDSAAAPETKYIVVFLSDGMPTDYDMNSSNMITSSGKNALNSDIDNLLQTKPGQVSFNTVYYGENNAYAADLMSDMAVMGEGLFLDVNANPGARDFLINSVVTVPGSGCPLL